MTVPDRSEPVIVHQARDRQLYHLRHTRDYEALGIPIGASKADAKAAYRQLAKVRRLDPYENPNILTLADMPMRTHWEKALASHADAAVPQMHLGMIALMWACSWMLRTSAVGKTRVLPCCKVLVLGWLYPIYGSNVDLLRFTLWLLKIVVPPT